MAKWQPEVKQHCPRTPYILVGTKTDIRYSNGLTASQTELTLEDSKSKKYISRAMGKKMACKIKAQKYIECSALTMSGVQEVRRSCVQQN